MIVSAIVAVAVAAIGGTAITGSFGAVERVADSELAGMRGGIRLPGGLEVAIGVAIETRIDGQLALRSELTSVAPGVRLFAAGPPSTVGSGGVAASGTVTAPTAQVISDRAATGTHVVVYPSVNVSPVNVGNGGAWAAAPSGTPLAVSEGGPGVDTAFGTVTLMRNGEGSVAQLAGTGIDVRQFIGAATGVIVANTTSNRVIDTATSINIDLSGVIIPANLTSTLEGVARAVGSRATF